MIQTRAYIPQWAAGVVLNGDRAWRVYVAIASHADKAGLAYVGMTRISALTGIDRGKITALVAAVERAGLIRREGIGPGLATVYRVCEVPPHTGAAGAPADGDTSEPEGAPVHGSGCPVQGLRVPP